MRICHERLRALIGRGVVEVRGLGLWAGVDIDPTLATGKQVSLRLAERGVLVKDTHNRTLRIAPPPAITSGEIDYLVNQFGEVAVGGTYLADPPTGGAVAGDIDQPQRADAASAPGRRSG
ncbi:hypothetical protein A9X01_25680 [Mycobacterium asiaticum]|uniref:Aminotransferase class III n=1 Tax=Mycobacterium asiaticum TaxID=1790 RepID=A0A1A3C0R5_MYCAS|nr:hypothetical protein A9X01_25680 [Mycobacterium asiaticum]